MTKRIVVKLSDDEYKELWLDHFKRYRKCLDKDFAMYRKPGQKYRNMNL